MSRLVQWITYDCAASHVVSHTLAARVMESVNPVTYKCMTKPISVQAINRSHKEIDVAW